MDGEKDGEYTQLVGLGNEGIPFSHLVDVKMMDFTSRKSMMFDIVTPSDSRKEWLRSRYGNDLNVVALTEGLPETVN